MTEELKLRDCPFCDEQAALSYRDAADDDLGEATVFCTGCSVEYSAEMYGSARATVIDVWNRRAVSPEVRALVMAATRLIAQRADRVGKKYGGPVGIEMDDGEKGYIVHSDDCDALAAALKPFSEVE